MAQETLPFSQDALQADYVGTLDGVLDFAYRDIILEEIRAGRGVKGNQTLRSKIADHFAKYPDDFNQPMYSTDHWSVRVGALPSSVLTVMCSEGTTACFTASGLSLASHW